MYDILLSGGSVVDGTGTTPPRRADLAVSNGRVAAIGDLTGAEARRVVRADGKLLLPGLIDTHVHADAVLGRPDVQEAMLRQGITTVILGQDGLSFAPSTRSTVEYVARYFAAVDGVPPAEFGDGCSVADFLSMYDRRTPINVSYLIPLGTVRHEVFGPGNTPADKGGLAAMLRLVERGLDEGAVGVSTGLEYLPGGFADLAELVALCRPAARVNAPYVSHLRSYADGRAPGMHEARTLGRESGVPVHVSHYRGRAEPLLAHLESCNAFGVDVSFDSYPHLLGNTILAMKALPASVQEGGVRATLERLADPAVRADLTASWFPDLEAELASVTLGYVGSEEYRWAEGLRLGEASERAGLPFGELVCELLVASELAVGAIIGSPGGGEESDMRALARDHRHMACSDGIYLGGHPHPRGWGAFARFLGRHTRELGDWDWRTAAFHLSGHPARRFGLNGRGELTSGRVADIAVVDPETVSDTATYEDPRQLAVGVTDVVVAGDLVLADGATTGVASGRALRRGEPSL